MSKRQGFPVPEWAMTTVVLVVTGGWAISLVASWVGWANPDPGLNGIMGAVFVFLGLLTGKSRLSKNTIHVSGNDDVKDADDDD